MFVRLFGLPGRNELPQLFRCGKYRHAANGKGGFA